MLVELRVLRDQISGRIIRVVSDGIGVAFHTSEPEYSELKALLAAHCFFCKVVLCVPLGRVPGTRLFGRGRGFIYTKFISVVGKLLAQIPFCPVDHGSIETLE